MTSTRFGGSSPKTTGTLPIVWKYTLTGSFWTVTKFPNYVVVYRPETSPLQVIAVLHGKRDMDKVLQDRLTPL